MSDPQPLEKTTVARAFQIAVALRSKFPQATAY
jgi:hypothetical protein